MLVYTLQIYSVLTSILVNILAHTPHIRQYLFGIDQIKDGYVSLRKLVAPFTNIV